MNEIRLKRGDTSPAKPGLVFLRYNRGKECWVTPERLLQTRAGARAINDRWAAKDSAKLHKRKYAQAYYHRPNRKAQRAAYYKRADVRAKYRAKYHADPSAHMAKQKEYNEKPAAKARLAAYRRRPEVKKRVQASCSAWRKTPHGRLAHNLRSRIYTALRNNGFKKAAKSIELFGCDFETFKAHLAAQFKRGMSWMNHGVFWHIDHVKPLCKFNLADPAEQKKAFHYTNCQPLWKDENLTKNRFYYESGV